MDPVLLIPTPRVLARSHLAPSTLNYWVDEGLVQATVRGEGQRYVRYWTPEEAVGIRAVKQLRDAGCPMSVIKTVPRLVEEGSPTPARKLLRWNGNVITWVSERPLKLLSPPSGGRATIAVFLPISDWTQEAISDALLIDVASVHDYRALQRSGRLRRAPVQT